MRAPVDLDGPVNPGVASRIRAELHARIVVQRAPRVFSGWL